MSRLMVDWTRCDGHGICHALVPEIVTLDEWGFPILETAELDDEILIHARRAARACPALALRVEKIGEAAICRSRSQRV
jgi:ferredoxin